jgi:DNA-directed RNA polymerase subunit M/transcription elongation factor TFIIS
MQTKQKKPEQSNITYYECDSCGYPFKHSEVAIYSQTIRAENEQDIVNFVQCPHCEELLVFEPYCYIARETTSPEREFIELRRTFEKEEDEKNRQLETEAAIQSKC